MTENTIEAVRLLVVSKEPTVVRSLGSIGEVNSWQLETVGSGWEALEFVQEGFTPDLLLLDLPRGDADSLHILRWLRRLRPDLPIILLCYPTMPDEKMKPSGSAPRITSSGRSTTSNWRA